METAKTPGKYRAEISEAGQQTFSGWAGVVVVVAVSEYHRYYVNEKKSA